MRRNDCLDEDIKILEGDNWKIIVKKRTECRKVLGKGQAYTACRTNKLIGEYNCLGEGIKKLVGDNGKTIA